MCISKKELHWSLQMLCQHFCSACWARNAFQWPTGSSARKVSTPRKGLQVYNNAHVRAERIQIGPMLGFSFLHALFHLQIQLGYFRLQGM